MVTEALCSSSSPPAVAPLSRLDSAWKLPSPSRGRKVAKQQQQMLGPRWDAGRARGWPELGAPFLRPTLAARRRGLQAPAAHLLLLLLGLG